jgi:hypothetical protein
MTRWFVLLRFGSKEPNPRWGGHKYLVSFNPFPLSNGHLDRVSFLLNQMGHLDPIRTTTTWCLLLWLQLSWEQEWRKKKAIQATRTQMNTKISLSQVTKCLEWIWTLERIWSLVCVLEWSLELLYWMQYAGNLDALNSGGWGVFIASTTKIAVGEGCCRWAHQTVWCATVHCLVRHPRHPTVRVLTVSTIGALTAWGTGQALFTVRCAFWRCSDSAWTVHALFMLSVDCCAGDHCSAWHTGQSGVTPDSPVSHRTVRCHTGQSGEL